MDTQDNQAHNDDNESDENDELDDDDGSVILHFQDNYQAEDSADDSEVRSQTSLGKKAVEIESKHEAAEVSGKVSKEPPPSWSKLGKLIHLSSNSTDTYLNGDQDWALIELGGNWPSLTQSPGSELQEGDVPIFEVSCGSLDTARGQRVKVLCPPDLESTRDSSSSRGSHDIKKTKRLSSLGVEAS